MGGGVWGRDTIQTTATIQLPEIKSLSQVHRAGEEYGRESTPGLSVVQVRLLSTLRCLRGVLAAASTHKYSWN